MIPDLESVFDLDWYLAENPDVRDAGVDALEHYLGSGWREGRDPCSFFNVDWYLATNQDVAIAGVEPLGEYLDRGWREGRDPSPWFSTRWYVEQYPEIIHGGRSPLIDHIERGIPAGAVTHPSLLESPEATGSPVHPTAPGLTRLRRWVDAACASAGAVVMPIAPFVIGREPRLASRATSRRLFTALGLDRNTTVDEVHRLRLEMCAGSEATSLEERLAEEIRNLGARLLSTDIDRLATDISVALRRDACRVPLLPLGIDAIKQLGTTGVDVFLGSRGDWPLPELEVLLARRGVAGHRAVVHMDDASSTAGMKTPLFIIGSDGIRHGEDTYLIPTPGALPSADRPQGHWLATVRPILAEAGRLRAAIAGPRESRQARVAFAGAATAHLPVALVAGAIEVAERAGIPRIHYMSREGEFLADVHRVVAPILSSRRTPPDAVHLAVSRRSTFGPALQSMTTDSLMNLWRMYSRQSVAALLTSLGTDSSAFRGSANRHGIDLDEIIDDIHESRRVRSFLSDPSVSEVILQTNQRRRTALLRYLEPRIGDAHELLVVDVGWRGTIQDNLATLLPDRTLHGVYLALFPFLNPQPENTTKRSVGPDGNAGEDIWLINPPAAIERPWTRDVPSVIDYRLDGGQAVPMTEKELTGSVESALLDIFQRSLLWASPLAAEALVDLGHSVWDLRDDIAGEVRRYYSTPLPGVADIWFSSAHDDTFGVLNVTPFGKQRPDRAWLEHGSGHAFMTKVDEVAADSLWPAGYRRWAPVAALTSYQDAYRRGGLPAPEASRHG